MSFGSIENHFGSSLDLTEYDFDHRDGIFRALYEASKKAARFTPWKIPDIVYLTPQQKMMMPRGDFVKTPFSIVEIKVKTS